VAIAPAVWGAFGGALLVGNFGDGRINAFNATTGAFLGTLQDSTGTPIALQGLWAIIFGTGTRADANTLYFAAGMPNGHPPRAACWAVSRRLLRSQQSLMRRVGKPVLLPRGKSS